MPGRSFFRLGHEIDCAQCQSLESGVSAFFGMGADQDYRQRSAAHNQAKSFHALHARHFQIEGDHIGTELFDLFQCESTIHGRADDVDHRIAGKDIGNQFPHQRGIIDDENSNAIAHAMASSGIARERRERTAGTFKIKTTVPSPRMEAPLTKSLATMSEGRALITNSSSPTN